MNNNLIMLIAIPVVILFAALIVFLVKNYRKQTQPPEMDEMEGHDFEYYCADVLRSAGFTDVRVTKGSGDFGADILAEKDGVTYAVQCKCYEAMVGVAAVQEVYAGKAYYERMVGAVMTNRYYTSAARKLAEKLNILLWDREYIEQITGNM